METVVAPKCVIDTLAALRNERVPLAARVDAIDIAIDNLSRVYGIGGEVQAEISFGPKRVVKPKPVTHKTSPAPTEESGEAATRRALLLSAISRSEIGLTIAELRKATPKMDGKDRSNAVQQLKAQGQIRRSGNTWVKAA